MDEKLINEKMADFIGLKKIKKARTIIGKQTYISDEIWVHKFNPIQDNQVIYDDNMLEKELVPSNEIINELTFLEGGDSLMEVYDHAHKLLLGFIENGKLTAKYLEGSTILGKIHSYLGEVTHSYKVLNNFIDWYNLNKEKFVYVKEYS